MGKLILISGISRSGKSTLAKQLQKDLPQVLVIHQDEYTLPEEQLPRIKHRIDWEKPDTLDWNKLCQLINQEMEKHQYLILEGIFALANTEILSLSAFTIALELDKSEFLSRRKTETRWGKEPNWFIEHVWQSHLEHHNPYKTKIDLTLSNINETGYSELKRKIEHLSI